MFFKTEFSIATATFFRVILFCSDLIHARFSSNVFQLKGLITFQKIIIEIAV